MCYDKKGEKMGNINRNDGNKCPICGTLGAEIWKNGFNDPLYNYTCINCGEYFIENPNIAEFEDRECAGEYNKQHLFSYLFYHKTEKKPVICNKKYFDKHITDEFVEIYNLTPEMVENWYPKSFAEKIDLILFKLADMTTYAIEKISNQLFFIEDNKDDIITKNFDKNVQERYIIEFLKKQEYIKHLSTSTVQLTPKALDRIYELQKNSSINQNVFIAMKFGEETKELREKLKEGLKGFNVRIMDEIEHNHQIVPEMLYEIKNSKFVIAELSHHNNGAYYEAGYALGLGKEVIHICDRKELDNGLHFDVAQINTIFYDDIDEIPEKLQKRIQATIKK